MKFSSTTISILVICGFLSSIIVTVYADDEDTVPETTDETITSTDSEIKETDPVTETEIDTTNETTDDVEEVTVIVDETNTDSQVDTEENAVTEAEVTIVTETDIAETTTAEEVVVTELEIAAVTEADLAVVTEEAPTITEANEIAITEDEVAAETAAEEPTITELPDTTVEADTVADAEITDNAESEPVTETNTETITVTDVNLLADDTEVVDGDAGPENDANEEAADTATTDEKTNEAETTEIKDLNIDEEVESELIGNMVYIGQIRNKNWYYSENFKVNYFQAYEICKDLGMRIVSINSKEENDLIFKNLNKSGENHHIYWTSGSKFLTGKNWIWMTTGKLVGYTNWVPGEPSETNKNCIELVIADSDDLKWNNEDCNEKLSFICESDGMFFSSPQTEMSNLLGILVGSFEFPVFNYNKKRYYAVNDLDLSFFDAFRACQMIGLELVTVTSEEENLNLYEHIRNSMTGTNFWSGGTRKNDTNWNWLPSGQNITYTKWQEGSLQNDEDKKCLQLIFKKDVLEWDAMDCNSPHNFICETPNRMTQVNGIRRKPNVVESIPTDGNKLIPATFKIKIIPPLKRNYDEWTGGGTINDQLKPFNGFRK